MRTLVEHSGAQSESEAEMGMKVESPRGFTVFAEGLPEALAREASAQIETVLEQSGVTAADIEKLRRRYQELGESGVDIQRLRAAELKRYAIDARHVAANKAVSAVLSRTQKKAPSGGFIGFRTV